MARLAPEPAAAVREHVRAFNEHDLDALMAGFTDDAVWITGSTVVTGRVALTDFFARAMAGLMPTLTVHSLVATADRAACELVETITVDGRERIFHIAGFYRFEAGLIATAKIYREGSADV